MEDHLCIVKTPRKYRQKVFASHILFTTPKDLVVPNVIWPPLETFCTYNQQHTSTHPPCHCTQKIELLLTPFLHGHLPELLTYPVSQSIPNIFVHDFLHTQCHGHFPIYLSMTSYIPSVMVTSLYICPWLLSIS